MMQNKKAWIMGISMVVGLLIIGIIIGYAKNHPTKKYTADGIEICAKGDMFNLTDGKPCPGVKIEPPVECAPGDKYSIMTGEPCPSDIDAPTEIEASKTQELSAETTTAPIATVEAIPVVAEVTTKPAGPKSGYQKAIEENVGKVLSFDDMCASDPKELTVAKNTLVVMANNGTKSHTLGLNGKSTPLQSKHYDLMFVGGAGSYTATCDGANAGTVVVK